MHLSGRWLLMPGVVCVGLVLLALSPAGDNDVAADMASPAATPCVPVATPEANVTTCAPVGWGTPVAGDGLVVTLTADSTNAGPVDLILEVRDATGKPVEDAIVEVRTRHIDMDHGVSTDEAVHQGEGRYLAERVSMGMGGNWEAEIVVTREGQPDVVMTFLVKLGGPSH
ncbi:MAG: FixH family protein [Thermomicrobiales bacterium]